MSSSLLATSFIRRVKGGFGNLWRDIIVNKIRIVADHTKKLLALVKNCVLLWAKGKSPELRSTVNPTETRSYSDSCASPEDVLSSFYTERRKKQIDNSVVIRFDMYVIVRKGNAAPLTDFPKASFVMMLLVATVKSSDRSTGFLL